MIHIAAIVCGVSAVLLFVAGFHLRSATLENGQLLQLVRTQAGTIKMQRDTIARQKSTIDTQAKTIAIKNSSLGTAIEIIGEMEELGR